MTKTHAIRAGLTAIALLLTAPAAHAGPIDSMEHYFRVSGAVNAAQGSCDFRADLPKLIELGKPYQLHERNEAVEERMMDLMVRSLNETGTRIHEQGHDTVCPELFELYGPKGTDVPGLLSRRTHEGW